MRVIAGMAHLAGGGPTGSTCIGCAHLRGKDSRCVKALEMARKKTPPIDPHEAACKYFAARPKPVRKEPLHETGIWHWSTRIHNPVNHVRPAGNLPGRYDGDGFTGDHAELFLAGAHGQLSPALAAQLKRAVQ